MEIKYGQIDELIHVRQNEWTKCFSPLSQVILHLVRLALPQSEPFEPQYAKLVQRGSSEIS